MYLIRKHVKALVQRQQLEPVSVSVQHHYKTSGCPVMLKQTFVEVLTFKVSSRIVRARYYTTFTIVIPYT